jgi:hypothetical protein
MKINIITVDRGQHNYISNTLTSLRASDWQKYQYPVTLCAGSKETDYLSGLGFDILPWLEQTPESKHVAFCMNYVRALRFGFGGVVILEDDVTMCPNWLETLQAAVDEIPFERYVLALYSAQNLSTPAFDRGVHYRSYFTGMYYGTQAMYFPESVRYEIADYIYAHRERRPGDLLLGEWANTNNCLYSLQGSVVQHDGRITTGLGNYHSAWNLLCRET